MTVSSTHRPNLGTELAAEIRKKIFDGSLPAGGRLNEVHLARSMGVSRTPLREALAALTTEGAVEIVPRRGFFVRALTTEEAMEIYPIRGLLDPEALRLSGIPDTTRLERLEKLATDLESAHRVDRAIRLDDDWHRELWADCTNQTLIDLIEQFMMRTRCYELASMRERKVLEISNTSKMSVIASLRNGNLDYACSKLRRSLETGVVPVLEWLRQREAE